MSKQRIYNTSPLSAYTWQKSMVNGLLQEKENLFTKVAVHGTAMLSLDKQLK
jgi:hypothetical protein